MIDWTKLTDDPNNRAAKEEVRRYLLSVRRLHTDVGLLEFIENLVEGKSGASRDGRAAPSASTCWRRWSRS